MAWYKKKDEEALHLPAKVFNRHLRKEGESVHDYLGRVSVIVEREKKKLYR